VDEARGGVLLDMRRTSAHGGQTHAPESERRDRKVGDLGKRTVLHGRQSADFRRTWPPYRLAADLDSATQGLTGADIAYLCQRAVTFCTKDAVGASEATDVAIARRHFDAALSLLTAGHASNVTPLLLAG
jgi:hypothetical protein